MNLLRKVNHRQNGQALILTLVAMALGSLMIVPLLNWMQTGHKTVQTYQRDTDQIYAADAGYQDALWRIQNVVPGLPMATNAAPLTYWLEENVSGVTQHKIINNSEVFAEITRADTITYKITSEANDVSTGRKTTVEAYINVMNLMMYTDNAITSPGLVDIQPGCVIQGQICVEEPTDVSNQSGFSIPVITKDIATQWPDDPTMVSLLKAFYKNQVSVPGAVVISDTNAQIDLSVYNGPVLFRVPGNPTATFSNRITGTLDHTIYVEGSLDLANNSYLDLQGNTIFVEQNFRSSEEKEASILGPGSIIALHDIVFEPKFSNYDPNNPNNQFVYIMSVNGNVTYQPMCDFVGSVAGNVTVGLQPNCTLAWSTPYGGLNIPGGIANAVTLVKSWTLK